MRVISRSQSESGSIQGVGVGLRAPHYLYIEEHQPQVAWFEVLIDNYLGKGGAALHHLQQIANNYPLTFHGVGMSLGSTDPLDKHYLKQLREMIDSLQPELVSDHLCWTSVNGHYAHDLLPLPYVQQAIDVVVERIKQIQDFIGRRILVENVSSYFAYHQSSMSEWEFLSVVADKADCAILLDINNIFVSAHNHNFDACDYLDYIDIGRVAEFHLAGYEDQKTHLLDTHGEEIHEPVWQLYQQALQRFGAVPTLIEWDNNIPAFAVLQSEAEKAQKFMHEQAAKDVA